MTPAARVLPVVERAVTVVSVAASAGVAISFFLPDGVQAITAGVAALVSAGCAVYWARRPAGRALLGQIAAGIRAGRMSRADRDAYGIVTTLPEMGELIAEWLEGKRADASESTGGSLP